MDTAGYPAADDDAEEDETTYTVTRFYQGDTERDTVATGLTLDEAQAMCHDPETSSSTATSAEALARTLVDGAWFCGYGAE
jgi:hypothetical protein